jgi:Tfp pilus assembly protein PilN
MLQALTEALPAGAWVQHLEWNGQALRIVGFRTPAVDVAAALSNSGAFVNPRSMTGATAPAGANDAQPFDITAEARRSQRP